MFSVLNIVKKPISRFGLKQQKHVVTVLRGKLYVPLPACCLHTAMANKDQDLDPEKRKSQGKILKIIILCSDQGFSHQNR